MDRVALFSSVFLILGLCLGTDANASDVADVSAVPPAIPRGPDEVPARIENNAAPKETTFDWPGLEEFLAPWTNWKDRLSEEQSFRLGVDYQPVMQWSDNSAGEDSAAGGIFRAFSSWDMWNKAKPSRTGTLDVRIEHRHKIGGVIDDFDSLHIIT